MWVNYSPYFILEFVDSPIFMSDVSLLTLVGFVNDFLIYGLLCLNIIFYLLIGVDTFNGLSWFLIKFILCFFYIVGKTCYVW